MSFGIRHTFRTQHISRKIARTNQQDNKEEDTLTNITDVVSDNNENVFESNQNFVSNVLNRSIQKSISISSSSSSNDSLNEVPSRSSESTVRTSKKNSNLVSARLNLLKNHNKGVTKSEDHF